MHQGGFEVEVPGNLDQVVRDGLDRLGYFQANPQGADYARLKAKAQEFERSVAHADYSCRSPLNGDASELLKVPFQRWLSDHELEYKAVVDGWQDLANGVQ